ncbi:MAG: hypothetical protein R3B06_00910 [Kofleriaceae bacterium]
MPRGLCAGRGGAVSRVGVALALALALAGAGCKRAADAPPAPSRPAPLPAAEVTRAKAACDDLVARLCACAQAHPDQPALAERCELKKAKPEALALALDTAARTDVGDDSVVRAQLTARKIVEKCVEEIAALPSLGCR